MKALFFFFLVSFCFPAAGCNGESENGEPDEELCSDDLDNDGDTLADCDDPDCEDDPVCAPPPAEICDDDEDNDGDTLADCDDPDCEDDPACLPPPAEICDDETDNDGDTLADCDDPDCADDEACDLSCDGPDDCEENEACIDGLCESLEGALFCGGPERALVLIDRRLYELVFEELHAYVAAACERRDFGIRVIGVEGIDDMGFEDIRTLLAGYQETYPSIDGALMVGNIPLPTFFMSRLDVPQTLLWPRYYEDLDMTVEKNLPDGTELHECFGAADADGYPSDWPCFKPGTNWSAPFTVPGHDFDDFDQGDNYGLELWAAFMPVGYGDAELDTYEGWAQQLEPFLEKTLVFYADPDAIHRNLYHVGNDLNMIAQAGTVWDEIGPENIDYYGINTLGEGECDDNYMCYQRAPLEDYDSLEDFLTYARTLPWMGEGWQHPGIFLSHLNGEVLVPRRVFWWNVHSTPTHSIITSRQARREIWAGKGGLIALLDGCMVGGFQAPGRPLPPDNWEIPFPHENMLVSLVYGYSTFVAAIGSVPLRTMLDHYGVILDSIYIDGYLGLANRERSDAQDRATDKKWGWRGHQEILVGDPFVDAY